MTIELHGYRYSVYLRIVAMTLAEKNLAWTHVEVEPDPNRALDQARESTRGGILVTGSLYLLADLSP